MGWELICFRREFDSVFLWNSRAQRTNWFYLNSASKKKIKRIKPLSVRTKTYQMTSYCLFSRFLKTKKNWPKKHFLIKWYFLKKKNKCPRKQYSNDGIHWQLHKNIGKWKWVLLIRRASKFRTQILGHCLLMT